MEQPISELNTPSAVAQHPEIKKLDELIASTWQEIFSLPEASLFTQSLMGKDKRVYALYMTQVYHYASHAARNLGFAGANLANKDVRLMHHLFEHAMEETGHELMALHDLKAMGVPVGHPEKDIPLLAATETIVAYVHYLATGNEPYKILGYSYWIEKPYAYILPFMQAMQANMGLTNKQMTFYYQHIEIDKKHGNDIEHVLLKICQSGQQWAAIRQVIQTTLQMTIHMFLEIIREYQKLANGESVTFAILNHIPHESKDENNIGAKYYA